MKNVTDSTRREGAWVGFLQEDVYKNRTGPIGEFVGNDSPSDKAPLYLITDQNTATATATAATATATAATATDPRDNISAPLRVFASYNQLGE